MAKERTAELKDRLKEALQVRQMRASELEAATEVPKSAISFYLAGKSKPKADRLYIIARALDVSEAWLLGYDVPMARTMEAKKNDLLAGLVVKMRSEPAFFDAVASMAELTPEQFDIVKGVIEALPRG